MEYFSIPLSTDGLTVFGHRTGDAAGQQVWECLCALIALRQWRRFWVSDRIALRFKADNVTLLTILAKLKCSGPGTTIIGKEIALLVAGAAYRPIVAVHTPGVANKLADILSRQFAPTASHEPWKLPAEFVSAAEVTPPARPWAWYAASEAPVSPPVGRGRRKRAKPRP